MYFEERLTAPEVDDHYARWHDGSHRGNATRNLRIYEKETHRHKFSCTLPRNGAKLQPYFEVPDQASGAHLFRPTGHSVVPLFAERGDADRFALFFPDSPSEDGIRKLLDAWEASVKPL